MWGMGAQIVDLYNDGMKRALETWRVWVPGCGYFEATPTGVSETDVGTECKRIDRRRVPVYSSTTR